MQNMTMGVNIRKKTGTLWWLPKKKKKLSNELFIILSYGEIYNYFTNTVLSEVILMLHEYIIMQTFV